MTTGRGGRRLSRGVGGLRRAVAVLLGGLALPGCRSAPGEAVAPPFQFIVLADPQLGMIDEDRTTSQDSALFARAVEEVNARRPAFVVVCGDLVNRPGDDREASEILRLAASIDPGIPVRWVAGNHDVGNSPDPASLAWYRRRFGPDRYAWDLGGWRFVVIDSSLLKGPENVRDEAEAQWRWLERTLRDAKARALPLVVFEHHPLFLVDPAEDDQYFNIPRATRKRLLDLFGECGVVAVFAGHYHRNARGRASSLEMVTCGPVGKPLGADPSGFTLVTVLRGRLAHGYLPLPPPPGQIGSQGSSTTRSRS